MKCRANMPWSKLTEKQIKEIYLLLKNTKLKYREIAEKYGVTKQNIYSINNGISWHSDSIKYPVRKRIYFNILKESRKTPLKKSEVKNIYYLLKNSKLNYREIGEKYGVRKQTIYDMNIGKNWHSDYIIYPIRTLKYKKELI